MLRFAAAAADVVPRLSLSQLRALADRIEQGWPVDALAWAAGSDVGDVAALLRAREADGLPAAVAAAYLRGVVEGYERGVNMQKVEVVFSGPATTAVPVRSTAQVLVDLIEGARQELLLVTYSARPYQPVLDGLHAASSRGVDLDIVVETLRGAGSALSGQEPAAAFADVPGVRLWHWPVEKRETKSAKMHAKIAVADRQVLFASSVNLTQSGVESSIEAGVIVRGGRAPQRVVEHVRNLQSRGLLQPL